MQPVLRLYTVFRTQAFITCRGHMSQQAYVRRKVVEMLEISQFGVTD